MNLESLRHMLDSYLATREAIGLKDRRHRKLLEDFLQHVAKGETRRTDSGADGCGLGLFDASLLCGR